MAKISTRPTGDSIVYRLQQSLLNYSMGGITPNGGGIAQVGDSLDALADQVDAVLSGLIQTLEHASVDLSIARTEATQLSVKVDELESIVENLLSDVDFDDALDDATGDLMDCLASSGAADVTADGELEFDERITFTRSDLKPYLQRAITTWIERRLES